MTLEEYKEDTRISWAALCERKVCTQSLRSSRPQKWKNFQIEKKIVEVSKFWSVEWQLNGYFMTMSFDTVGGQLKSEFVWSSAKFCSSNFHPTILSDDVYLREKPVLNCCYCKTGLAEKNKYDKCRTKIIKSYTPKTVHNLIISSFFFYESSAHSIKWIPNLKSKFITSINHERCVYFLSVSSKKKKSLIKILI